MDDKLTYVEDARAVFNHVGLAADMYLARCIGYAEDSHDCYWVLDIPDRGIVYFSMVMNFVSLKDIYPRYHQLDDGLHMNGCQRRDEFLIEPMLILRKDDD